MDCRTRGVKIRRFSGVWQPTFLGGALVDSRGAVTLVFEDEPVRPVLEAVREQIGLSQREFTQFAEGQYQGPAANWGSALPQPDRPC